MIHFAIAAKLMAIVVQMPQFAKMADLATVAMVLRRPNVSVLVDTQGHFVRNPQVGNNVK